MAGSFNSDAMTCSKENDHSTSDCSEPGVSWPVWGLLVSVLSGDVAVSSAGDTSAGDASVGDASAGDASAEGGAGLEED